MPPIHVMCVDDSADVLAVLSMLLDRAPDLECVGTLSTVDDLAAEAEARSADVVVIDLGIPGFDSIEQLREMQRSGSIAKTVVFSGDNDDRSVNRCLEAGAAAFVTKATDPRILLDTIRSVARNSENEDHPGQVRFFRGHTPALTTVAHHLR